MLGRPAWSREALEHQLSGVLERINEACFEQLDMPLFEEADPLVLLPEAIAGSTVPPPDGCPGRRPRGNAGNGNGR